MRKITKRSAIIASAAVVVVGGAGAAFAAWSLNSSATVTSTADSASPLVVSGQALVGTLYPGSINSVQFNAHNPNKFPVKVTGISYSDVQVDSGHSAACGAGNLIGIATAPLPNSGMEFSENGASGDNQTITYLNSIRLIPSPETGCQGAQFAFKINLTVVSNNAS